MCSVHCCINPTLLHTLWVDDDGHRSISYREEKMFFSYVAKFAFTTLNQYHHTMRVCTG